MGKACISIAHVFEPSGLSPTGIISLGGESKLAKMLLGRKQSLERLKQIPPKNKKRVWAHAASLGEFQMLLPLLQKIETELNSEIHVSFFSPSGYEHAEMPPSWQSHYLQQDTPLLANRFVSLLQPDLVIFAKYEFWLSHIRVLNHKNIPFLYWNVLLRNNHFLTKSWAQPWRNALKRALVFGCQNITTQQILTSLLPTTPCLLTGDIRFLQTAELKNSPSVFSDSEIKKWEEKPNIVWGSSWQEELEMLIEVAPLNTGDYRFVLAPHDVSEKNLLHIESKLHGKSQRLSQWMQHPQTNAIVLVDGIGKLKYIYRHAKIAIIGGGFKNALHNIIEPLSLGVPVLFGSNHEKFPEAQEAVNAKAALHANTPKELARILTFLLFHSGNSQLIRFHQSQAQAFFESNTPKMEGVWPFCLAALTK